jgi:hypothetical protein
MLISHQSMALFIAQPVANLYHFRNKQPLFIVPKGVQLVSKQHLLLTKTALFIVNNDAN